MAWTAPRTWVLGEILTAALLNTHLRDNMNTTAPAKVTTAGDIVYATAANTLARLAIGGVSKVLVGGASAPVWAQGIGSAADNATWTLTGTAPTLRWSETDAGDPADYWERTSSASDLVTRFWDDSAAAFSDATKLTPKDFMLHTGKFGTDVGALIIKVSSQGSKALTTSGTADLAVTITTGGPAYVIGWYSIEIRRTATGSSGNEVHFVPEDDGSAWSGAFSLQSGNDWAEAMIPNTGETGIYSGLFFRFFGASNTSTWSVNMAASVNSVFSADSSQLIVMSVQYPA